MLRRRGRRPRVAAPLPAPDDGLALPAETFLGGGTVGIGTACERAVAHPGDANARAHSGFEIGSKTAQAVKTGRAWLPEERKTQAIVALGNATVLVGLAAVSGSRAPPTGAVVM